MSRAGRPENLGEYAPDGKPYQGTLIRTLRREPFPNIKTFAEKIEYHCGSIAKIETNYARASMYLLNKIAEVVDVSVDVLTVSPIHPRLLLSIHNRSLIDKTINITTGQFVDHILNSSALSEENLRLAGLLIEDVTRATVLRLSAYSKK